jgi:Ca-activated chloride channel family protein
VLPDFANPALLLLLLDAAFAVWWGLRPGRGAFRYPGTADLADLPAGRSNLARRGGAVLRGAGLGLIVLALAGPRWPDPGTRIPTEGIAITILLDVSGSMAERDFKWTDAATGQVREISRLEAAKRVLGKFVEGGTLDGGQELAGRDNDLIALVTFATRPETVCPLTLSHSVLLDLLDQEQPRSIPSESQTNIGDAIGLGLHRLRDAGKRKQVLVLLTDGEHNVGPPAYLPTAAAQLAGNLHVPIYVIDAGSDTPTTEAGLEPGSVADRLKAKKTLQKVAHITNGQYFEAQDTKSLVEACARIDELERTPIESYQYRRYYEAYPWLGLAAFLVIGLLLTLEMTAWRRLP